MLARFQARQLANPSGLVGRLILAPLWNRRNAALNDAAFEHLELGTRERVLEVGFGGGYLLGRMARTVTQGLLAGVDVSPAMVASCMRRHSALVRAGRLELRCAPAEEIPYPSCHFTRACSVNSIMYWHDAPRAIAELRRVLVPGGRLVLCFTCRESLQGRAFARHGVTAYGRRDVVRMLHMSGFGTVHAERLADRHRAFWCITCRRHEAVG